MVNILAFQRLTVNFGSPISLAANDKLAEIGSIIWRFTRVKIEMFRLRYYKL